ncbi:olfactory receptor 1E16-like [Leptodactylus fuscus]|uniref:olfactory receptor 1E16-like n=1 Tax=Leptodactylus fuscus TaxID=238119 RepID=UPI003F4EB43B
MYEAVVDEVDKSAETLPRFHTEWNFINLTHYPRFLDGTFFKINKTKTEAAGAGQKVSAYCKACPNKLITGQINSTSNFLKHLRNVHPSLVQKYEKYKESKGRQRKGDQTQQPRALEKQTLKNLVEGLAPGKRDQHQKTGSKENTPSCNVSIGNIIKSSSIYKYWECNRSAAPYKIRPQNVDGKVGVICVSKMYRDIFNETVQEDFTLKIFSGLHGTVVLILGIFLMYLLSALGNLIIIVVVCSAPRLHTPMYFFLCNLSIQDLLYVSNILPKLLVIQVTGKTQISFLECFTQMFVFAVCVDTEYYLLTCMAFDRYVAICIPLRYSIIMNKRVYITLALISWMASFLNALLYVFLISHFSFCDPKSISNFFCDIKALIKLSCSDVTLMNNVLWIEEYVIGLLPFAMILTSYVFIISTILKIKTSATRLKVFSSCSSHLTVVFLFCGTSLSLYMKPDSKDSSEIEMSLSLLYVGVVPALNPLVYSLRNREVLMILRPRIIH